MLFIPSFHMLTYSEMVPEANDEQEERIERMKHMKKKKKKKRKAMSTMDTTIPNSIAHEMSVFR